MAAVKDSLSVLRHRTTDSRSASCPHRQVMMSLCGQRYWAWSSRFVLQLRGRSLQSAAAAPTGGPVSLGAFKREGRLNKHLDGPLVAGCITPSTILAYGIWATVKRRWWDDEPRTCPPRFSTLAAQQRPYSAPPPSRPGTPGARQSGSPPRSSPSLDGRRILLSGV